MKSVEEYYYTVYTHCNILVDMYLYVNMLQHLAVSFMLTCTPPTLSLPKICIIIMLYKKIFTFYPSS